MGNGGPYWILGVNGGGAWQDSDVKALPGGGWSFYLGHSLTNKPNAFFSTDLRFRYLNSNTFGQNSSDDYLGNDALKDPFVFNYDPDSAAFAHNHKTDFHDLSLELRANFEELRRKSRIHLSAYAGIGMGVYGSQFDQLDANGSPYNYDNIDYSQSEDAVIDELITIRDGEFETNANPDAFDDNQYKVTFTPTVGAELGYWFSPSFSLGLGYRTTFTMTDEFEGIKSKKNNASQHHYASLNLHWRLQPKKSKVMCPDVKFSLPATNNQTITTSRSNIFVSASVSNVVQLSLIHI